MFYQSQPLWQKTLADQGVQDPHREARDKLRTAYVALREKVEPIAAHIHSVLPEYTVHDITHLDSLWEIASLIVGEEYNLTPTEAFVFGGAILLHDLGMALVAFPGGIDDLKKSRSWNDLIVAYLRSANGGVTPTSDEIASPPTETVRRAMVTTLRNLHAEQAERLASQPWTTVPGSDPIYLIESYDIRHTYGRLIGRIANSHGWMLETINEQFTQLTGAPVWCPPDWTVDPLKLACLLWVTDAAHLDARRAPFFLRALRRPSASSDVHWSFQEKINKPFPSGDALVYTSGPGFPIEDASAWWLCLETLRMVDHELQQVDALLADRHRQRFSRRRVAGVESPERLKEYIRTSDWIPIDVHVQISNIPKLVKTLGGEQLYGSDLTVPLRELLQNSGDAVRARRIIENRADNWGEITVRIDQDNRGYFLEIEDNGIGMSVDVLTHYLLDFGSSYWESERMLTDLPNLMTNGFEPTGQYGIGFFSIFMLGEHVQIRTRRYDAAVADTLVLDIVGGIDSHPVLRTATTSERLRDGGTAIKVWLQTPPKEDGGVLSGDHWLFDKFDYDLFDLVAQLIPASDVSILAQFDGALKLCVEAHDWMTCDPQVLFARLPHKDSFSTREGDIRPYHNNLRLIKSPDGRTVGRAVMDYRPLMELESKDDRGVLISSGGVRLGETNLGVGFFYGRTNRVTRDSGALNIPRSSLEQWMAEQVFLYEQAPFEWQWLVAWRAAYFSALIGNLHFGIMDNKSVNTDIFRQIVATRNKIYVTNFWPSPARWKEMKDINNDFRENCLNVYDYDVKRRYRQEGERNDENPLLPFVFRIISEAWGVSLEWVMEHLSSENLRIGSVTAISPDKESVVTSDVIVYKAILVSRDV